MDHERYLLAKDYDRYYITPDQHPNYRDEWIKFWDVRSAQLRRDGEKPEDYDFTNEWRDFFLCRLKILKKNDYYDIKEKLYEKYRTYNKKTKINHLQQPKHERRGFKEFSKSEHKRCYSNSRSHTRRYPNKKQNYSAEKKVEPPSVVSICRDLSHLDSQVVFNRPRFNDLMYKAIMHEKIHNREYLMNKDECELFKVLLSVLRHIMLVKKFSKVIFDDIKEICSKIEYLIGIWENFKNDDNFYSNISSSPSPESLNNVSEFAKRQANERKYSSGSSGYKSASNTNLNDIEPTLNRLKYFTRQVEDQNYATTVMAVKSEPFSPVSVKIEKIDNLSPDMLSLMQEKQQLLKEIYESSAFPNLLTNSETIDQSQKENDTQVDYIDAVNQNASFTAKTITDEELISHLKDLENLTEEKQNCIYQIMVEIEQNDQERFNRLKIYIYQEEQET